MTLQTEHSGTTENLMIEEKLSYLASKYIRKYKGKQIVVAATQRSGSSMVCEDIADTGTLGIPQEWFADWKHGAGDWSKQFHEIQQKGSTRNAIFSVKIMANQLGQIEKCLDGSPKKDGATHPRVIYQFGDALWVWVRRRDTIGQAISHFLARQTGIYHVQIRETRFPRGASVGPEEFEKKTEGQTPYDYLNIMRDWYVIQQHELIWEQFFKLNGIEPLVVWYEDATKYPPTPKIAERIRITLPERPPRRAHAKMPSERNEWIRERLLAELFSKV